MVMKVECYICGGDCSHAYGTYKGYPCHIMCIPVKRTRQPFIHTTPKPDACEHDFQGWRPFPDDNGGEQVCTKCGMGAMAHSLRIGP